jgi:pimeloyl-ACP methyl ester carboxylesterase
MAPIDDWLASGDFFIHRGHRIFYRRAGDAAAPVLLLIHGFPTSSWDWEAVWPDLTQRYRLLAVDMIGFGFSDKPTQYDYRIADQADIQEAFLRLQSASAYHVLAHDYGDTVAQELLARQSESGDRPKLRSVCFLNGGLFPETHRPTIVQRLLQSPIGGLVTRWMTRDRFARSFTHVFGPGTQPAPAQIDAFWELIVHNGGIDVYTSLIRYIGERRAHRARWVSALQRGDIPLKLIDGVADPVSGAHMAERYRQLVPRPDVTLLDRIGHYPQIETPQRVVEEYLGFRTILARS